MAKLKSAHVSGFIRATADQSHPLQTKLNLIITDFEPNGNKQGIPKAEAENILRTAPNTPLKINFDGIDFYGHKGAVPIGPITNVYFAEDNGREVIAGEAIIWNDIYEDVADHLKVAFAEGLGTSWEIYFKDSETDDNGVQWLEGCVFAGTCVVATPAYGPNRTRVLAIAESLTEHANEVNERLSMANEQKPEDVEVETTNVEATEETTDKGEASTADDVNTLRGDISAAMDLLGTIYNGFYTMLDETYELEQDLATTDMESVAEQFNKLVAGIQRRFESLRDKASTAETALSELKQRIADEEAVAALEEKKQRRLSALAEVGLEPTEDRVDFYVNMDDAIFDTYVSDLKSIRGKVATSENNSREKLPDPSTGSVIITPKDLAEVIKTQIKRGK